MVGVSLPYSLLRHGGAEYEEIMGTLVEQGVGSIEIRSIRPDSSPEDVVRIAEGLRARGMEITLHATVTSAESAVQDVFGPLSPLFSEGCQEKWIVVIHPINGDNVAMLRTLADHAVSMAYPIVWALENNRLLPDGNAGDSAALVLEAVEAVDRDCVGICFDMGHYAYDMKARVGDGEWQMPPKAFLNRVVHTHVHALNGFETHYPLGEYELPLERILEKMAYGYFGVYNVELTFARFSDRITPVDAIRSSVSTLRKAMPHCARLYERIRRGYDGELRRSITLLTDDKPGTRFSLLTSTSFLFATEGFHWAMDIAFRQAYRLADSPRQAQCLLAALDLMIISHGHADHFEERTVRQLAQNRLMWIIPDFLLEKVIACGVSSEKILVARPWEEIRVGPLTVMPFPGRHFRPDTGKGTEEYGYLITTDDGLSMAFPVDTRDFSTDTIPKLPSADICFANVWLGDHNGVNTVYDGILEPYTRFMLRFSQKHIFFAHLYENGRKDADMWRREHAERISQEILRVSPQTSCHIPLCGEIYDLTAL